MQVALEVLMQVIDFVWRKGSELSQLFSSQDSGSLKTKFSGTFLPVIVS